MGIYKDPFMTFQVTITVTVNVKIILILIIPWDLLAKKRVSVNLEGYFHMVTYIWSFDGSILSSMQGRSEPSGDKLLHL